jgi:type IV pilus assembly protein PilM
MATAMLTGVDIGSTSVRAVQTSRGKGSPVVTKYGQVAIPIGAVHGGIINDETVVSTALKVLWSEHKFRRREVVVGVTSHQIVVREMSLPNLPPREFRQALPFQVRDLLPMPVNKAQLDFYPLEDPRKAGDTVRGFLIAAPKEVVLSTVRTVEAAGLRVIRVDLASFAVLRATGRVGVDVEAIADIGAHATSVIVHVDGQPRIVRTLPRGGADITEVVATQLKISGDEAEALKRNVGLSPGLNPAVAAAMREAVRPLVSELRSSFAYLASGGEAATRVSRLSLCGGSALMPGLVELMHSELGVEVYLADPLMRIGDNRPRGSHDELGQARSSAAVSIGLALAAAS